jgi:hypothetical protein
MYGEGLARQLVLLALVAILSLHAASERRKDSFRTYVAWQTLLDISQRTPSLKCSL